MSGTSTITAARRFRLQRPPHHGNPRHHHDRTVPDRDDLDLRGPAPDLAPGPHRRLGAAAGGAVDVAAFALPAASVLGKLLGVHMAGKVLGCQRGEASIIGWLLQTKALIMIIFSNMLLDKGVITNNSFSALLPMAVPSTMLTVPLATPNLATMRSLLGRNS